MKRKEQFLKINIKCDIKSLRVVERQFEATILDDTQMEVGGYEGIKRKLTVFNPRSYGRDDVAKDLTFVTKECRYEDETISLLEAYHQLRKTNFPVPNTTRIYLSECGSLYQLVMTDMTENGKYALWGFSNKMHKMQGEVLRSLNLSDEEVGCIEKQANEIAHKAANEGHRIRFFNYHLRKNLETGMVDVVLLDIGSYNLKVLKPITWWILQDNLEDVQDFMKELQKSR